MTELPYRDAAQFEHLAASPGRVLFLGDSITEGCNWSEWFPELRTLNRGIGGDTVGGLLGRLDTAVDDPAVTSLLIGTNDLGAGDSTRVDDIAAQYRQLLARIVELAPDSPLIVNSVMPRQARLAGKVHELNGHISGFATEAGATYLDLWPAFADANGGLRAEFTSDSLHLNGTGYRAWTDLLKPHLEAFGRTS